MSQEKIIQMLAGISKAARRSGQILTESSANFIEKNVIQGKYVSREEYNQLKRIVNNLERELIELKSKSS